MPPKVRICLICRVSFKPDSRTRHQKVCSRGPCQSERKRRKWRRWATGHRHQRRLKSRLWARSRPDYWSDYRKSHPAYRAREIKRMRLKRARSRRVAKQTLIRRAVIERLRQIEALDRYAKIVAKPTPIARQVNGVIEFLIWKEGVAKQTHIVSSSLPGA